MTHKRLVLFVGFITLLLGLWRLQSSNDGVKRKGVTNTPTVQAPSTKSAPPDPDPDPTWFVVEGTVVDQEGALVTGAQVGVRPEPKVLTDGRGHFRLRLDEGKRFVSVTGGSGVFVEGPRDDIVLKLRHLCPFTIEVVDEQGDPIAEATVNAASMMSVANLGEDTQQQDGQIRQTAQLPVETDEVGNAALPLAGCGVMMVSAEAPRFAKNAGMFDTVDSTTGRIMLEPGTLVKGRVVDDNGAPLDDFGVFGLSALVQKKGGFEGWTSLDEGDSFFVSNPHSRVTFDSAAIEEALDSSGVAHLTATLGDEANTTITCIPDGCVGANLWIRQERGATRCGPKNDDVRTCSHTVPGTVVSWGRTLADLEEPGDVTIDLKEATASVTGSLTGRAGAKCEVTVNVAAAHPLWIRDIEEHFEASRLFPGPHRFDLCCGGTCKRHDVDLPGGTTDLGSWDLAGDGEIHGVVQTPDGAGIKNLPVWAEGNDKETARTVTGSEGKFSLRHLANATYVLKAHGWPMGKAGGKFEPISAVETTVQDGIVRDVVLLVESVSDD